MIKNPHFKRWIVRGAGVALFVPAAWLGAVEIPLRAGGGSGERVGFVDMDRIYQEYPETRKARSVYRQEVARHKQALVERERELEDLEREISRLKSPPAESSGAMGVSTGSAAPPEGGFANILSTGPAPSLEEQVSRRAAVLEERRAALDRQRTQAVQSLREFEARQSQQILGRLYRALTQLADERGLVLVVEKSAILYGQETVDLTEALSRRVRGLPDAEAP